MASSQTKVSLYGVHPRSRVRNTAASHSKMLLRQPNQPATTIRLAALEPQSLSQRDILQLQRTVGNHTVSQIGTMVGPHSITPCTSDGGAILRQPGPAAPDAAVKENAAPAPVAADGGTAAAAPDAGVGEPTPAAAAETTPEDSGAQWVDRFPTSTSTADLAGDFATGVDNFISALSAAGAQVSISATYRPKERAYLMHYAFAIARSGANPANVPGMAGVNIRWQHLDSAGKPDLKASRAAAEAMVQGYDIVYAPALNSRHTEKLAIDMSITWTGKLTIAKSDGKTVTISSSPRTGAGNSDLHAVGASYGVHKLKSDAPHWSSDGS